MSTNPNVVNAITNYTNTDRSEIAILGGGCFWCIETMFRDLQGVEASVSGYAGGKAATADYESVCSKTTDHIEVIMVQFDPAVINYEEILQIFFAVHDPTTPNRQGNDVGPQYRSAIFYVDDRQREIAEKVMKDFAPTLHEDPIVTELRPFSPFYPAEDAHQDYFNKVGDRNPYCSMVVKPKVGKFRKSFAHRLKSNQPS